MYLVYLLILLAFPFVIPLVIRYLRRGKIVSEGTVRIPKVYNRNVFVSTVWINGRQVEGLFDTGASQTTIGIDLARSLGFDPDSLYFDQDANTAAGVMHGAIVNVTADEFQVGPIILKKLGIGINRYGGEQCLVGMSFSEALDSFEIKKSHLTLVKDSRRQSPDPATSAPMPDRDLGPGEARIPAACPLCITPMTLPANRVGNVRCHSCNQLFFADTESAHDGTAICRSL